MAEGFPVSSNFDGMFAARGPVGAAGNDPAARLEGLAAGKLRMLRQHTADTRALLPDSDELNSLRMEKAATETRLKRLRAPAMDGGFAIKDDEHPSVVGEQAKLDAITAELNRLTEIDNVRSEKWRAAGGIVNSVENWVRIIPDGHSLAAVDDPPLAEILKKNERADDAIPRLQRRIRELRADKHRVYSAPYPSAVAKQKAREQIERLAAAGEPNTSGCVEHLGEIVFAMKSAQSLVHDLRAVGRSGVTFTEIPDSIGLLAFLFKDQFIAKIESSIEADSDDDAALDETQRAEQQAQIDADLLDVERSLAALVWQMRRDGVNVEFDKDLSPAAILGVALVAGAPREAPTGSSPERTSYRMR